MTRASYDPDTLLVGIIGRPHGLAGEVTLRPYNGRGTNLAGVPQVILERDGVRVPRAVRSARRSTDGWLLRLEGVDDRDAAAALVHVPLRVPKRLLPPLAAGEFFVEDLLGCVVRNEEGVTLGVVDSVFWNGAQDVMSIVPDPRDETTAVPRRVDADVSGGDPAAAAAAVAIAVVDPGDILIPVVPAFVRAVDAAARVVTVAWDPDHE